MCARRHAVRVACVPLSRQNGGRTNDLTGGSVCFATRQVVQGSTFRRMSRLPINLPPGNQNVTHSNRRTLQLLTLTPLALAFAMSASAANRNDLHNQNVSLLNSQYKVAARTGMPVKAEDRHAEMLGLDAESRLSVLTHNQDLDGTQHYRY